MSSDKEEVDIKDMKKPNHFRLPNFSPNLVFPHGKRERNQSFFNISDGCYFVRSIPEMRGMCCLSSSHGWLIMLDYYSSKVFLLNPISMEKVQLPLSEYCPHPLGILTSSPSDPNCVVMLISCKNNFCLFCRPGDKQWVKQYLNSKKEPNRICAIHSAIDFKGKIYFNHLTGIAVMNIYDTYVTVKTLEMGEPMLSIPYEKRLFRNLVESCGELFLVIKIYRDGRIDDVETIDVFKLDVSRMVQVKVESLGDRVFLLGRGCTSVSASELGIKGDCIYFFEPVDRSLYRFNMYNQTISVSLPCPNVVREWCQPYWVVPNLCSLVKQGNIEVQVTKKEEGRREQKPGEDIPGEILKSSTSLLKEEEKGNKRLWEDIPKEILELIASRLFLGDCIRFHITCQSWKAITSPLRAPPLPFQSNSQQSPWLMFFPKNNCGGCKFFHLMYDDACFLDFPEVAGAVIRHSKYGWWLMSRGDKSLFFFNPFTRETINLPDLDTYPFDFISVSFSSPPTSQECIVFCLEKSYSSLVNMFVWHHGEDTWTWHEIDGAMPFFSSYCNPIFYDGVFFCLDKKGKLGVFNPKEELQECVWRVLPILKDPTNFSFRRSFIVECDGELLSIFIGHLGKPIYVSRLDRSEKKWVKLETLGSRMLFLSHTTSLLLPAMVKGTENKIYFPRFHGNNIVFYSLCTGKYHTFGGSYAREDWYDTEEQGYCTRFEPNVDAHGEQLNWVANPQDDDC